MRLMARTSDQAAAVLQDAVPIEASRQLLETAQLAARWRGREQFVILDTALDFGEKFLLTWNAWRADANRPTRLHYIAIDESPYRADALQAAHDKLPELAALACELRRSWPIAVAGMHRVLLSERGLTLTIVFGSLERNLPQLDAAIDAFLIDAKDDAMWASETIRTWFARLAQSGAVVAQTARTRAGDDALHKAGFFSDGDSLCAEFRPRRQSNVVTVNDDRSAIVIGAGLAGTAICQRLCARGWEVILIERHEGAAQEASGNLAGVFMPQLAKDDSPAARLSRAAFLFALRLWHDIGGIGVAFEGAANGVLQLARDETHAAGSADLARYAELPGEFARYLDAGELGRMMPALAEAIARGSQQAAGAWLFSQGGWAHPGGVCAAMLATCGDRLRRVHNRAAVQLTHDGRRWHVLDDCGMEIAQARHVVVANGVAGAQFSQTRALPLGAIRGQVTHVAAHLLPELHMPLCGDGYFIPARGGFCSIGATYDADFDTRLRADSQRENLARLASLFPASAARLVDLPLAGRAGLRCVSPDRLPLVGNVPDIDAVDSMRGERLRDVPRHENLHCLLAYGSRGLTLAPLAAELLAARICEEPLPLERDLCATVDPARFVLQTRRREKNKS
jgi:tRNA 5-methylaminomethyl-2-thiouridine biosynthesis bifunctional protein